MTSPIAILDANALFPFTLRDTLLRVAHEGYYQARWTTEILAEMERNLVAKNMVTNRQAQSLTSAMKRAFPEAMVTGYEHLIPLMRNDKKDRHVEAAAVETRAQFITTSNVRDFYDLPQGIEVQTPDDFLCGLFPTGTKRLLTILESQANTLSRPPMTLEQLLDRLAKMVPKVVSLVRKP